MDARAPAVRPPTVQQGFVPWLRANLFSSPLNSALTIALVAILALVVPKLVSWAVTNAVFAPDPNACRAAKGACWGFIVEKFRLMTFGTYPYDEQWRPLLVMIVLLSLIGATMMMRLWGRWLWTSWAIGVPAMWVLMRGGEIDVSFRAMALLAVLVTIAVLVWRSQLPTGLH